MSSGARCLRGDQSIGARCPRGEVSQVVRGRHVHWGEVSSNPFRFPPIFSTWL